MVGKPLSPSFFTGLEAMKGGGLLDDAVYPMYFGVACAFFSLDLMSRSGELRSDHAGELMLKGSAQLLGLLVERVQARGEAMETKLRQAGSEIEELKKRRAEDAKANEKVASIFAAREHCWISERKSLRRQIQALLRELCALQSRKEDSVERVETMNGGGYLEEEEKRRELEEKLLVAEQDAEELKQRLEKEAQDHADELWKHKATLMELLSERCRMESELSRSLGQVEAAREKLKQVVLHKEEADAMAVKLSEDVAVLQKDCELKDKVLSAMARKSKLDTAEKQALLKQVQILRAMQKQAEAEMERMRQVRESKHKKKSSRASPLAEAECSKDAQLRLPRRSYRKHLLLEYLVDEGTKHHRSSSSSAATDHDPETTLEDCFQHLEEYWIQTGNDKHAQRHHHAEVAAFAEQMRQKDEKLEDLQKLILSEQLEKKMLQSHIQGLDGALSHFREENIKLEALLMEKSKELKLLKEQLSSFLLRHYHNSSQSCSSSPEDCQRKALLSEVKKIKEKLISEDKDSTNYSESQTNHVQEHYKHCGDDVSEDQCPGREEESSLQVDQAETGSVALDSPKEEVKRVKEVSLGLGDSSEKPNSPQEDTAISDKLPYPEPSSESVESSWKKTDIHARSVSYSIKRLKQQLLVLDKLAGLLANKHLTDLNTSTLTAGADEASKTDDNRQKMKGFLLMKSLVQKQVKRYQSLEEKTDFLYGRMYDDCRSGSRRDTKVNRIAKEQTETLKCYLEEAFKLQKYFVATGQKFIEMQSKISSSLCGADAHDKSTGFNLRQFADIIRSIFRQVQKGLEVRIARMIGDLEGKLACDSILQR